MNSLPQSPQKAARLVATLASGLLWNVALLAQPTEQSPIDISRSGTVGIQIHHTSTSTTES